MSLTSGQMLQAIGPNQCQSITASALGTLLANLVAPATHATTHKSGGSDAIKLDELAAPTDITTLNVSTSAHGLCPKAPNSTAQVLRGDGSFGVPVAFTGDSGVGGVIGAVPAPGAGDAAAGKALAADGTWKVVANQAQALAVSSFEGGGGLVLSSTSMSFEVLTDGITSTESPVVAAFADVTTTTFLAGASDTITTNTTAVTAVAAPGASTQREVKFVSVQNADSVARTVTMQLNDATTKRILAKGVLQPGDSFVFSSGKFQIVTPGTGVVTIAGGGTGSSTAPTSAQIPVANAGGTAYVPRSISGDGTLTNTGVLTVTKTNGVSFAASATTDTTNGANVTGVLAASLGAIALAQAQARVSYAA